MYFLVSSILFLLSAIHLFKHNKFLSPAIVFCVMWGIACLAISLVQYGIIFDQMRSYFIFQYMNEYIVIFSLVSILAFYLVQPKRNAFFIDTIPTIRLLSLLKKYRFIMYLSFIIGLTRIILFISLFNVDTLLDYRNAFVYNSLSGYVGFIFRVGNWVQLFADVYIALLGFYHGKTQINAKTTIINFIYFSTMQMGTGGRLFVLYFIVFYFGPFAIGRYYLHKNYFMKRAEFVKMVFIMIALLITISYIGIVRNSSSEIVTSEDYLKKYMYITDGIQATDYCMTTFQDNFDPDFGKNTFGFSFGDNMLKYREENVGTRMGVMVYSILIPLYLDFTYYGSFIAWFFIAIIIGIITQKCMYNLSIMKLLLLVVLMKIMFESVIFHSFSTNYPFVELLMILYIFRKRIFRECN